MVFGTTFAIVCAGIIASLVIFIAGRNNRRLREEINIARSRANELGNFLSRFASGVQSQSGLQGVIPDAACYIAETLGAESVAIYKFSNDELIGTGAYGPYPFREEIEKRYPDITQRIGADVYREGEGFAGQIAANRQPELLQDPEKDSRWPELGLPAGKVKSIMGVPMLRDGLLGGVIIAVNNRKNPARGFRVSQYERLQLLSQQILMIAHLVQTYGAISNRERLAQELTFARQLQQSLLPNTIPQWGSFSIYAATRSAKEVNGDFYDFIKIDENRLLIILGDAAGKGIPACLLSTMARSFARAIGTAGKFTTLTNFMKDLNNQLLRDTDADRFLTLGCCLLDKRLNSLEFCRAGHTDLVCFIHKHLRIFSPSGVMLGMLPEDMAEFETICIAPAPGSRVMMFSDGYTEAANTSGREFGFQRLCDEFAAACELGLSPENVLNYLSGAIQRFESNQGDDQTMVIIQI